MTKKKQFCSYIHIKANDNLVLNESILKIVSIEPVSVSKTFHLRFLMFWIKTKKKRPLESSH